MFRALEDRKEKNTQSIFTQSIMVFFTQSIMVYLKIFKRHGVPYFLAVLVSVIRPLFCWNCSTGSSQTP